jgi:hypothetical protein
MIIIEDVWSAIDKGYEKIADLQHEIARKSRTSGDINIYNKQQLISVELLAYLEGLEMLDINHEIGINDIIERLYNNIKLLTKNLTLWD